MTSPQNEVGNFLDPTIILPEEDGQLRYVLRDAYYRTADTVNNREIALYPLQEILCGEKFFTVGNNQKLRDGFRKVVSIGAVAAGATATIAHGIVGVTSFTRVHAFAQSAANFFSVPYASVTANANVEIYATTTNIILINGAAAPNITSSYAILHYLKN